MPQGFPLAAAVLVVLLGVMIWKTIAPAEEFTLYSPFFFRAGGNEERLLPMSRVGVGDELFFEVTPSADVYLYILNEDEEGHAYVLFPDPELDSKNPLRGGIKHRLPGTKQGEEKNWEVNSVGGTEHFLVVASRERLPELERDLARFARASEKGSTGLAELSGESKETLRGIQEQEDLLRGVGRMKAASEESAPARKELRLADLVRSLSEKSLESTEGVLIRNFQLWNPGE